MTVASILLLSSDDVQRNLKRNSNQTKACCSLKKLEVSHFLWFKMTYKSHLFLLLLGLLHKDESVSGSLISIYAATEYHTARPSDSLCHICLRTNNGYLSVFLSMLITEPLTTTIYAVSIDIQRALPFQFPITIPILRRRSNSQRTTTLIPEQRLFPYCFIDANLFELI